MPPQKNAGAKASKRVSNVQNKNKRLISAYLDDIRKEGDVSDVYVGRVIGRLGNGRMSVFYIGEDKVPFTVQAIIRGTFRGKAKRSVWIEVGSIVMVSDSGIDGSAQYEIVAVLSQADIDSIRNEIDVDPRILAVDVTDSTALMTDAPLVEGGFQFEEEVDVDAI